MAECLFVCGWVWVCISVFVGFFCVCARMHVCLCSCVSVSVCSARVCVCVCVHACMSVCLCVCVGGCGAIFCLILYYGQCVHIIQLTVNVNTHCVCETIIMYSILSLVCVMNGMLSLVYVCIYIQRAEVDAEYYVYVHVYTHIILYFFTGT